MKQIKPRGDCKFCSGNGYIFVNDREKHKWESRQCKKCGGTGEDKKANKLSLSQRRVRWGILNQLGR
jgi:hypothetical protein